MSQQQDPRGRQEPDAEQQQQGRKDGWTRANDDKDRWHTAQKPGEVSGSRDAGGADTQSFVPDPEEADATDGSDEPSAFGGQDDTGRDLLHGNAQSAGDEAGVRAFGGGARSGPQGTAPDVSHPAGHYDGRTRAVATDEVERRPDDSLVDDDEIDLNEITQKMVTPARP